VPQPRGDPRNGSAYRRAVATLLAQSDLCWLCGHPGAHTADHVITVKRWLTLHGTYAGVNHPTNMRPAHGTKGPVTNPCPVCGLLCNQVRGDGPPPTERHSREW
jgi:hypothetical protein